jgi:hypothetical protein
LYVQYKYEKREVNFNLCHGGYDWGFRKERNFFTKEECIALLKEYQDELEKEKQGINERIREIEAN